VVREWLDHCQLSCILNDWVQRGQVNSWRIESRARGQKPATPTGTSIVSPSAVVVAPDMTGENSSGNTQFPHLPPSKSVVLKHWTLVSDDLITTDRLLYPMTWSLLTEIRWAHHSRLVARYAWVWVCKWGPHKFPGILSIFRVSEVWKK
jgi:hypothetical protein